MFYHNTKFSDYFEFKFLQVKFWSAGHQTLDDDKRLKTTIGVKTNIKMSLKSFTRQPKMN